MTAIREGRQYAELHCQTNFSFLSGASHADELVQRAAEFGYRALAITDENSLAGIVRAYAAARQLAADTQLPALPLIYGAELLLRDAPPAVLWATDRASYGRLAQLLTVGRRRAPKGQCWLQWSDVVEHNEGLLVGVISGLAGDRRRLAHLDPTDASYDWFANSPLLSCPGSAADSRRQTNQADRPPHSTAWSIQDYQRYHELFGDRAYLLAELFVGTSDAWRLSQLQQLATLTRLPMLAAGDVLYHSPARMPLHDVLTAIRHHTTVDRAGDLLLPNAQRHLRPIAERYSQFEQATRQQSSLPAGLVDPNLPNWEAALRRTIDVADRCHFCLSELRYEYPEELAPDGQPPFDFLKQLTWDGAHQRYPQGIPARVQRQLRHELELIEELKYEAYFLTVWDLVRYARQRQILCQGRGSAANSAVCFCLGITSVDPDTTDLLFERFISRERNEVPDIDVDFEHERREEVLQYLYEKYGRHRAGLAATVVTYRSRSAIRDVGKALGYSLDRVDALAKQVDGYHNVSDLDQRCASVGIDPGSLTGKRLVHLVDELTGFPRHLSQHVGGMVMTRGRLDELVPIENAAMEDRTVIQWDKNDLEELGLLKVDCLCLGMLSAIRKCFAMVADCWFHEFDLATVPQDDCRVYDMICDADTVGVFQIESRGQMSMLPRLKPRCWYDLVIEVAIVRPGPIQGNMVHPYLRRRNGEEATEYPNAEIEQVLKRTLGVPIFQEQAMKLAVVAAGFTPGEADQLRRAMGAWRKTGVIEKFQAKLMEGMRAKGLSDEFANQVFRQIRGFGEYGFPESHAASFALLVYVSAYLKFYYPAAFTASLLNSLPMGFYAPAQLVADARRHAVQVLPVDVNSSDWDHTLQWMDGRDLDQSTADQVDAQLCLPDAHTAGPQTVERPDPASLSGLNLPDQNLANAAPLVPPNQTTDASPHVSPFAQPAIRLGLRQIVGFPEAAAERIMKARSQRQFTSIADLARRTALGQALVERLSRADAFQSLQQDRRAALWQALGQERNRDPAEQPLLASMHNDIDDYPPPGLPSLTPQDEVFSDYRSTGLSLKNHPLAFYRRMLDSIHVSTAAGLAKRRDGMHLRVAGLVILRQRPSTAKGITFVTLEDETGTANLVVKQPIWQKFFRIARTSAAWIAHGKLEKKQGVIHVVVNRLQDLSQSAAELRIKSRDFR